jgi:hypothetical protein
LAGCGQTWEWVDKRVGDDVHCTQETHTLSSSRRRRGYHHREPSLAAKAAPSRRGRRCCAAAAQSGKSDLGFPLTSRVKTVRTQNHTSKEGDGTHRCHCGLQRNNRAGFSPGPKTAQRRDGDAPKAGLNHRSRRQLEVDGEGRNAPKATAAATKTGQKRDRDGLLLVVGLLLPPEHSGHHRRRRATMGTTLRRHRYRAESVLPRRGSPARAHLGPCKLI